MFCIRNISKTCISAPIGLASKARYSRRSDWNTDCYKPVKSNNDTLDGVDDNALVTNPNWELLTPQGFRFYLPGSVGPGWLDVSTTAQVDVYSLLVPNNEENIRPERDNKCRINNDIFSILHCTAQQCPTLLRKGIIELFPHCLETTTPHLTIVTISQNANKKRTKWSREVETEKLAQYFVLAASDICKKLQMCGYWADFINPFSGQPYMHPHKNKNLYTTDERFRSVGFKIDRRNNCQIISHVKDTKNFIGNLYTTAPASVALLQELMTDLNYGSN